MVRESSYVGPGLLRFSNGKPPRKKSIPSKKSSVVSIIVILGLVLSILAALAHAPEPNRPARSLTKTTIPLLLFWQHYDTAMVCNPCGGLAPGPHNWNDAGGVDGIYGTIDDCPHCSAYCAPASIAMIAAYRGIGPPGIFQDWIYDNGKVVPPENKGNGIIETHGEGMFDGTGGRPAEVQLAMTWSLGLIIQHNQWDASALAAGQLQAYISGGTPVLWLDHGGFPANQSALYPPLVNRTDQGHAKVIAGYDDSGTVADTSDDICLIYDPWPEYSHKGILPWNCTQDAPGVWDPYWQPLNDINLADVSDMYLADTFPAIPEFPSVLVPVLGTMVVAAVALGLRREQRT